MMKKRSCSACGGGSAPCRAPRTAARTRSAAPAARTAPPLHAARRASLAHPRYHRQQHQHAPCTKQQKSLHSGGGEGGATQVRRGAVRLHSAHARTHAHTVNRHSRERGRAFVHVHTILCASMSSLKEVKSPSDASISNTSVATSSLRALGTKRADKRAHQAVVIPPAHTAAARAAAQALEPLAPTRDSLQLLDELC
jgi:hypothetical protein